MKVLLVEPEYYTQYPPLGLLKLASYYRSRADSIKIVRGNNKIHDYIPDKIEITSLFTYAWKKVHDSIKFYHNLFPDAKIRVGGIYASLLPQRIKSAFPYVEVIQGLFHPADAYLPSYDMLEEVEKWKNWNKSILFTSRGCIRKCPFCMVPIIEGNIKPVIKNVSDYIYPTHKELIIWDNNFLASPIWKEMVHQIKDIDIKVDFNQGLDARLVNETVASEIADMKIKMIRLAYDTPSEKAPLTKTVELLNEYGINKRKILVYALYNFYHENNKIGDTPDELLERIKYISNLGCVSYPMRYEPLYSLEKNKYMSPLWKKEELEMVAKARRVIGFGGAFPPYKGLINKLTNADNFYEAFSLRDKNNVECLPKPLTTLAPLITF